MFDVDVEIISELIKKSVYLSPYTECLREKQTIDEHVKSEYELCLGNKSRPGVPLTCKFLCTCRYGTIPQHHRFRDTDWINNRSVNRICTTRLLAISRYRGKALDVFSGSFR